MSICSFQVRSLSLNTPKTRSDSTLVSYMPLTGRSRVCFAEFAIFCLVEIILYFVFAACIFTLFSFAHFDAASMSGLIFSSTLAKVGADAQRVESSAQMPMLFFSTRGRSFMKSIKGEYQEHFPAVHRIEYRVVQIFTVDTYLRFLPLR